MKPLMLLIILFLFFKSMVYAIDKTYVLSVSQFEDLVIEGNGVRLNNFSIAEKKAWLTDDMTNIEISFSARNRTNANRSFAVMVVGMDEKNILWGVALEPMMSLIAENSITQIEKSVYIAPGTLRKTTKLWIRVIGNF